MFSWEKILKRHPSAALTKNDEEDETAARKHPIVACPPSVQYAGYGDANCVASTGDGRILLVGTLSGDLHVVDTLTGLSS